ncbi:MAG: 1,4-beta-xylanase [Spirochaetes bacterium]|nr:1,4-beta-xylanase [Spirochaetota bacterium]
MPSTAVNQLEMWQADTFDLPTIGRELSWAAGLGMNAVRVFLHDLAWRADPAGFLGRLDRFLSAAARLGIRTMPVLFDDCWHPNPAPGPQADPVPGVHNSRWVQSPGVKAAVDPACEDRLRGYVQDVIAAHRSDDRVLAWDLYNEVGNFFLPAMSLPPLRMAPRLAVAAIRLYLEPIPTRPLLRRAFAWAREVEPSQPLTTSVWIDHARLNRELVGLSDIVSFHDYHPLPDLEARIRELHQHGRPLLCTEFMARTSGSRFQTHLPVFKREGVGCLCWGLVSGKTQTIWSWKDRAGGDEPAVWFHDILRPDSTAFDDEEVEAIRRETRVDAPVRP